MRIPWLENLTCVLRYSRGPSTRLRLDPGSQPYLALFGQMVNTRPYHRISNNTIEEVKVAEMRRSQTTHNHQAVDVKGC